MRCEVKSQIIQNANLRFQISDFRLSQATNLGSSQISNSNLKSQISVLRSQVSDLKSQFSDQISNRHSQSHGYISKSEEQMRNSQIKKIFVPLCLSG